MVVTGDVGARGTVPDEGHAHAAWDSSIVTQAKT